MDHDLHQELRAMGERISGVSAAMEVGFSTLRRDVHYLGRAYMPALIVAGVGLILSICSLFVAMDNRSLILTVSAQTAKNTRDLENVMPVIFQNYAVPDGGSAPAPEQK